jgi:hypothetical protein
MSPNFVVKEATDDSCVLCNNYKKNMVFDTKQEITCDSMQKSHQGVICYFLRGARTRPDQARINPHTRTTRDSAGGREDVLCGLLPIRAG